MKVSKLIKKLKKIKKKHGNLECWYAKDDEGNDYDEIYFNPSIMYKDDDDELTSKSEVEDEDKADYNKVICVN